MMSLEQMRALFPHAERAIHLNHAGVSSIARPVAEAVQEVLTALMAGDPLPAYLAHLQRQEALRQAFGRLLSVAPETVAFVRNTSHGIAIVAQSIPFQPGDAVIVAGNEYPANLYPWMAQAHRGVTVRLVPPREDGYVAEEDLTAACAAESSPRVLAVSWVQWGTGQRMDLTRLGAFCRERGILLAVDMVQGLGALRPDLSALPVDFATAGSHKWLLAPGGLGILYVRPEVMPTLLPTNAGWNSVERPIDWEHPHFEELKPTTDRFEEGTPSILATAALGASVALLESVGFDTAHERVLALSAYTRAALRDRGMRVLSPEGSGQDSGIVAFRHPTVSNDEILNTLTTNGIAAAVRCGNVRLSPHAYNREVEIDMALNTLPSV